MLITRHVELVPRICANTPHWTNACLPSFSSTSPSPSPRLCPATDCSLLKMPHKPERSAVVSSYFSLEFLPCDVCCVC